MNVKIIRRNDVLITNDKSIKSVFPTWGFKSSNMFQNSDQTPDSSVFNTAC
jgi:hypothetical protein